MGGSLLRELFNASTVTIAISVASLSYTIWVDKYKYRGRPSIYLEYVRDGIELTIINRNNYPIQISAITYISARHLLRRRIEIPVQVFGRHPPFVLNPTDRSVIGVPSSHVSTRGSVQIRVHISSGTVSFLGALKKYHVSVRGINNVSAVAKGFESSESSLAMKIPGSNLWEPNETSVPAALARFGTSEGTASGSASLSGDDEEGPDSTEGSS